MCNKNTVQIAVWDVIGYGNLLLFINVIIKKLCLDIVIKICYNQKRTKVRFLEACNYEWSSEDSK